MKINRVVASEGVHNVFLDQPLDPDNPSFPYYSLRAPDQAQSGGITWYFDHWEASLADVIAPDELTTPVVFTARILDSAGCLELGLADRIVPADELSQAAHVFAGELARNAPLALRAAKRAIIQGLDLPLEEALKAEGRAYDSLIPTRDREEGLKAFREKRSPEWGGS